MTRDEVLLLKVFDSRRDGRTRCGAGPHLSAHLSFLSFAQKRPFAKTGPRQTRETLTKTGGAFLFLFLSASTLSGCHCAFKDPLTADPKAFRESIETRCLVILPKGIDDTPSFTLMDQAKL